MADSTISGLSDTFTTYAGTNLLVVVDVTDATMATSGTDKKLTVSSLFANYPFVASGSSHAAGAVPDPGSSAGSTRFLCENAEWSVPTTAIPSGTAGRVPFETTGGVLTDSENLTFVSGDVPKAILYVGGVQIKDDGYTCVVVTDGRDNVIFRGGVASGWADHIGATFFQVGPYLGSVVFCTTSNWPFVRLQFSSSCTQFTQNRYYLSPAPTGTSLVEMISIDADVSPLALRGATSQVAPLLELQQLSSTEEIRNAATIDGVWSEPTDAIRTGQLNLYASDYSGTDRLGWSIGSDGTQALIGAYGTSPVARQTVTGSKDSNAALASLITALETLGLITDDTS